MSERRDPLEQRLDEAFASMRPRAGFESELLDRVTQTARPLAPARAGARWWAWAGAAAAVVLVAFLGFAALGAHRGGTSTGESLSRPSAGAAGAAPVAVPRAAFGSLPRPQSTAATTPGAGASQAPAAALPVPAPGGLALVARYREPAAADADALAAALGASGQGGRFTGPGYTLLVFPTDPKTGLQAHYLLSFDRSTPAGRGPAEGAARAAADAFLKSRSLTSPGPVVSVSSQGPFSVVRYANSFGAALDVYVAADGTIYQADGPLPAQYEVSSYPLASLDALRSAAGAGSGDRLEMGFALAFDGRYGYYEPVATFIAADGTRRQVPAIDASYLR